MSRQPPFAVLLVVSLALFLRLLVPTGWMPVAGAGPFAVEPCPAAGPAILDHGAVHHHGDMHHAGHQHTGHNGDCAFAPFAAGAAPAAVPAALLTIVSPAPPPFREAAVASFPTGPPALPPPATGPPALT